MEYIQERNRARRAVDDLGQLESVCAVELIEPSEDPTGCWTVEMTVDAYCLPPAVLSILVDHGLSLRQSGPRQGHWHGVAVV